MCTRFFTRFGSLFGTNTSVGSAPSGERISIASSYRPVGCQPRVAHQNSLSVRGSTASITSSVNVQGTGILLVNHEVQRTVRQTGMQMEDIGPKFGLKPYRSPIEIR